ncbi:response regulator transcription factor [Brooklawnia cerclae]|uniref:DNA-binding NarL/FixJ family response regulator n=1 Tax=Brooklawnia cerclae TaxID=349934 RepID=A0ABX0SNA2_9ACTN|nr:DNA-binding NarL/FixJ family response regulator [Brooklawnia cerclae]
MTIRLVLADDQQMVRVGFRMVLDAQSDMTVVSEAGTGHEALAAVREHDPDVVLMDIRMPDMDGIEATRRVVASGARARVLVLTTFDLDDYVFAALQAGASGFLLKDAGPADLLSAIRAVHSGNAVVAPSVTRRLLERFLPSMPDESVPATDARERLGLLSDREQEVLGLVARGLTNQEIAERLFVAEATVKTHVSHILTKLDLRDRVHMVVFAYDAALVRPAG